MAFLYIDLYMCLFMRLLGSAQGDVKGLEAASRITSVRRIR